MRIVVLDGYTLNPGDNPWTRIEALGELTVYDRTPPELLQQRAGEAEILLTNKTPLNAASISQLERLKFVAVLATGFNIVDISAARAREIPVSNVPEYGTQSVAQHVVAAMLYFSRRIALHDQLVRKGEWQRCGDFSFWQTSLVEWSEKKIGIVGFGRIGQRVGHIAHALGMEVVAFDPHPTAPPPYEPFRWATLDEVFRESDVVTLHCPQTDDNVGMVNRRLLEQMKPTTLLVNTARGGLIDEPALATALHEGVLAGAALDVLSEEPPPADHPLLGAPNCLLTPHMAWATIEARRRLMAVTADNIEAFLRGEPQNVVNG